MNVLLITWTFAAACASVVTGVWMMLSANGEPFPGVITLISAALVLGLGVQLCRERLTVARPRPVVHHEYVYQYHPRRQRPANASQAKHRHQKASETRKGRRGKTKNVSQITDRDQVAAIA